MKPISGVSIDHVPSLPRELLETFPSLRSCVDGEWFQDLLGGSPHPQHVPMSPLSELQEGPPKTVASPQPVAPKQPSTKPRRRTPVDKPKAKPQRMANLADLTRRLRSVPPLEESGEPQQAAPPQPTQPAQPNPAPEHVPLPASVLEAYPDLASVDPSLAHMIAASRELERFNAVSIQLLQANNQIAALTHQNVSLASHVAKLRNDAQDHAGLLKAANAQIQQLGQWAETSNKLALSAVHTQQTIQSRCDALQSSNETLARDNQTLRAQVKRWRDAFEGSSDTPKRRRLNGDL